MNVFEIAESATPDLNDMEWSCPCCPSCWVPNETHPIGPTWLLTPKMGMSFTQHHESSLPMSETYLI